jgi:hypothetical protein
MRVAAQRRAISAAARPETICARMSDDQDPDLAGSRASRSPARPAGAKVEPLPSNTGIRSVTTMMKLSLTA